MFVPPAVLHGVGGVGLSGQGLGSCSSSRTVRLVQPLEDAPDDGKYLLQATENIWTISRPALGADPALPAVQVVEGVLVPAARAAQNLAARAAVVPPPHHREPGHYDLHYAILSKGMYSLLAADHACWRLGVRDPVGLHPTQQQLLGAQPRQHRHGLAGCPRHTLGRTNIYIDDR